MSRGIQRERDVRRYLESDEGGSWWTARAAGSLGDADVIALKEGHRGMMIEVKSTAAGPFHSFGPMDRKALMAAARKAGLDPVLAYWPPRGQLRFLQPAQWPG